jgi:L-asparaginase
MNPRTAGVALFSRSLISAGFRDPLKARLLLHILLSRNASREQVAAAFAACGAA